MQLIDDWKAVAKRAWSMWALYASILLGAAELALPFLDGVLPVERGFFALLVFVTNILAAVTRLLAQRRLSSNDDDYTGVGA